MKLTRKKRQEAKRRAAKRTTPVPQPNAQHLPYPYRTEGRTYIQLGDGFEFIIERPHEQIKRLITLSATTIYDLVKNDWIKYRSTLYKVGDQLHGKFYARAERPNDFANVPVITYADLAAAGYMIDFGPGGMAGGGMIQYSFDYNEYKRRRKAANIIFDDVKSKENETGVS
ncbi:MAG: hypothetical protein ABWX90_03325 [Candidatus Saccharimonadales bacterium]